MSDYGDADATGYGEEPAYEDQYGEEEVDADEVQYGADGEGPAVDGDGEGVAGQGDGEDVDMQGYVESGQVGVRPCGHAKGGRSG